MQELSKRRAYCSRLYLLSDEDLIEVLCCNSNLENLSKNIGRVFAQLESLNIDSSASDQKILGCFGKNKEYFPLEMPIIFKGSIEELINSLQESIPDSLRYLLELSLSGKPPPFQTFPITTNESAEAKTVGTHNPKETRQLPAISESFEAQPPALFAWTLQHTTQIVELTLRILFTRQIETCLATSLEDLKIVEIKFRNMIAFYAAELCSFKFEKEKGSNTPEINSGIIIKSHQHHKMRLIVKLLIYYKNLINELLTKNCNSTSIEWLSRIRYYAVTEDNEFNVLIKTLDTEVYYGFEYHSYYGDDAFSLNYDNPDVENILTCLISLIKNKSNPLIHGEYVS